MSKMVTCPHCGEKFSLSPDTALSLAREERDVSLAFVAEAVGTSIRDMARIEKGQTQPRIGLAKRIAAFYDKPLDDLFPDEDEPATNHVERVREPVDMGEREFVDFENDPDEE